MPELAKRRILTLDGSVRNVRFGQSRQVVIPRT
jgi:hypothetical protein